MVWDYADTQAFDVVTFDFKDTDVRCFVSGSSDYQMNYCWVQNVPKLSQLVMEKFK